jgi:cobalt-zinc-cadmium efflux system outer membrane protein
MIDKKTRSVAWVLLFLWSLLPSVAVAQELALEGGVKEAKPKVEKIKLIDSIDVLAITPTVSRYLDTEQGTSSIDLIRRALSSNAELQAARLEIERSRARLTQARLRPNPSIDFEQTTGSFTGSKGERETSIGFALPLEIGGKRQKRIDLAQAEIAVAEAEIAERERLLIKEVRAAYADALVFVRELQITENLNSIDTQSARVIEARVTEGDSSSLELNLFRVEIDRLKSRRVLLEGRLQAAILKIKTLAGISPAESLKLREDLAGILPDPVASVEEAIDLALQNRPDVKFARLVEQAALAGFQLAKAQSLPDVSAFSKYSYGNSVFDNTPVGILRDKDKLVTFGVSISLPFFNRNQGAKAEAEIAIRQAERRREFIESVARSEVAQAYARYDAARNALATFEKGVIERSTQNLISVRKAYELGAFSVSELLIEQRKFLDSQREFIDTLAERYRALADIQSATGLTTGKE